MKLMKTTPTTKKTFKITLLALALSLVTTACTKQVQQEAAQDNAATTNTQNNSQSNTQSNKQTSSQQSTSSNTQSTSSNSNQTADQRMAEVGSLRMEPAIVSGAMMAQKQKSGEINYVAAPTFAPSQPRFDMPPRPPEQSAENYQQHKTNPVFMTQSNPVSTFSIDVDTASYSNVRRMLNLGQWPHQGSVRVEEMINYFDYQYQGPTNKDIPFSVHTEIAPSPWANNTQLLKIGLQGYEVEQSQLPPLNLVFLVDVSGSMRDSNKLPLLKRAFTLLTKKLRPQDSVSIVTYAGASGIALEPTSGDNKQAIIAALDKLNAAGSTNGGAGITLAYQKAREQFKTDGVNRVILASDGDFNVGITEMDKLEQLIKHERETGVNLTILGFGQGNYNDHLTEKLSNMGNGNAYYIDNFAQARKVFSQQLTGTLQTIAKDVKIQVEFNPAHVSEYRLIGYDNRALANEDFNNDKVDAGDIGAGHTVTAFYEITLTKDGYHYNEPLRYQSNSNDRPKANKNDELAFVKLRYKAPNGDTSKMISQPVKLAQVKPSFEQASEQFKFATAVVGFAEQLRQSHYINWSLTDIAAMANKNLGEDKWGYRREFMQLAHSAESLSTRP